MRSAHLIEPILRSVPLLVEVVWKITVVDGGGHRSEEGPPVSLKLLGDKDIVPVSVVVVYHLTHLFLLVTTVVHRELPRVPKSHTQPRLPRSRPSTRRWSVCVLAVGVSVLTDGDLVPL